MRVYCEKKKKTTEGKRVKEGKGRPGGKYVTKVNLILT